MVFSVEVSMTDSHREKKRRGRHVASEATLNEIEELSTFAYDKLVHGDSTEAKVLLLKALELSAKTAYAEKSQAVVLTYLGQTERMMGDHASSIGHLNQAIELCRQTNMLECELQARLFLAEQLTANGDFTEAQGQFELAYNTASFLQDRPSMELAAGNLGSVTMTRCHLEAATDWFNTALELAGHTESGEKSVWLGSLGLALSELGQFEQAVSYYRRAYLEAELIEDVLTMSICRGSEGNIRFEQCKF
jgi:tetratricopeptide (TPR) repeat protein